MKEYKQKPGKNPGKWKRILDAAEERKKMFDTLFEEKKDKNDTDNRTKK
jgi:hypothetical protein